MTICSNSSSPAGFAGIDPAACSNALVNGFLLPLFGLATSTQIEMIGLMREAALVLSLCVVLLFIFKRELFEKKFQVFTVGAFGCVMAFIISHSMSRSYGIHTSFDDRPVYFTFSIMSPIVLGLFYLFSLALHSIQLKRLALLFPFCIIAYDAISGMPWQKPSFPGSWQKFCPELEQLIDPPNHGKSINIETAWLPISGPSENGSSSPWCQIKIKSKDEKIFTEKLVC